MKFILLRAVMVCWVIAVFGIGDVGQAGTVQDVKEGSTAAAKEIKEGAVETGEAFVDAGKKVKEGSKKTWREIKKGVKAAGGDFKKAFKKENQGVQKETSRDDAK